MALDIIIARKSAASIAAFKGAVGEIILDPENWRLVLFDGATVGGHPIAKLSEVPRTVLSSNTTYYVRATGSDATGLGSAAAPWATVQYALNFVTEKLDGAGRFGVTIDIGAGSFVGVGMYKAAGLTFIELRGAGSGSTTLLRNPASDPVSMQLGCIDILVNPDCIVFLNAMTLDFSAGPTSAGLNVGVDSLVLYMSDPTYTAACDIVIKGGSTDSPALSVFGFSTVYALSGTLTIDREGSPTITQEIKLDIGGYFEHDGTLNVISGATYTGGLLTMFIGNGYIEEITSTGTFAGKQFDFQEFSSLGVTTGTIPGALPGTLDVTSAFNGQTGPVAVYTVATLPAAVRGQVAFASDCRVFNGAGVREGAGAGTGGLVSYNGTAWKIVGTNVTAAA